MTDTRKQQDGTVLVHWTYSLDEWHNFMSWQKKKKGFFSYLVYRLFSRKSKNNPKITITEKKVVVDDTNEAFNDSHHQLRRVAIHDAGNMNVMKISYDASDRQQRGPVEINILVPKGKLREAIQLQERLTARL